MTTNIQSNPKDFIRDIVTHDVKVNKNDGRVHTRFPPEPNGYLHIGHAKSICLNFGIAKQFSGGLCNLRFDDTNPTTEDMEYVESIQEDIRWLGFDWENRRYYASDYFEQLYQFAIQLIQQGNAYVCSLTPEQIRETRGTLTEPGKHSPYRNRSITENLELFKLMRSGEFPENRHVLRAKIDMASPNIHLRDPVIYRIRHASHYRTGKSWCIYPMYDYAHCLSDSLEGITHSICTLEFEIHRPLYDWILDVLQVPCHPQQIEFARLNLSYTVMSKRKLMELVEANIVAGWDDPRMPTISGLRRRGYTPEAIRNFCDRIGVTKFNSLTDIALLEFCLREDLNKHAARIMAVMNPLKVEIINYPEDFSEDMEAINNPEDPTMGKRSIPFSRIIYIDRDDFREQPPKKFFRLAPGKEVRLRYAYYITCVNVIKDEKSGDVVSLQCTYDPETKGGWSADGRKVQGTIHWVSAAHAIGVQVRSYDRLFTKADLGDIAEDDDFKNYLNPQSMEIINTCLVEPSIRDAVSETRYQFERVGYFCVDRDSKPGALIFNQTVGLRDSWSKIEKTSN